jgi:hypothetical protein
MTIRAVILGLLGAVLLCSVTFFNDMVMRGTFLVGNFLPITVFGSLALFVMLANPILRLLGRRVSLSARELAVIVALVLFSCYVPGRGLMHEFSTFLMLPHHYARTTPGWQGEPALVRPEQVLDWDELTRRIAQGADAPEGSAEAIVWHYLPETGRKLLAANTSLALADQNAFLKALNEEIQNGDLGRAAAAYKKPLPNYAEHLRESPVTERTAPRLARALLDIATQPALKPRRPDVLSQAPPRMLADPSGNETRALDGFVNGLATGDETLSPADIPWSAWRRTLWFWIPVILSVCLAVVGLSLVIHRQWSTHERLPYPTVEFARALLPSEGSAWSPIFRNRLFWLGAGVVFAIHMNNYAYVWWPEILVPIRLRFSFYPVLTIFPIFRKSGVGIGPMFNPSIYFTVIGFAYLLSTDISLSLGIAPYVYAIFAGMLASYAISVNGPMLQPYLGSFFYAGGFCGMFAVLLYTGRQYYRSAFLRSFGLRRGDPVEGHAIWGVRMFLLGMGLFVFQLSRVGLNWQFAVLYAAIMTILMVVISRLLAEAGVFYLHAYFFPCAVLWGFLGPRTIGPDQMLIMSMLSSVLLIDPREAFMPYVVSALQLVDQSKGKVGRTAGYGYAALALGLAAAVFATIYLQYQHGAIKAGDGWTSSSVPRFAFNATGSVRNTLEAQGLLPLVDQRSFLARLREILPMASCVLAFLGTFTLVIVFTICRHRFAWWPIHPLLFLVLATWQSRILAFSFLLGWAVKRSVAKYGGARVYQRVKPLMIGLVAGEMLAGLVPMVIGAVYYMIQGEPPKSFAIYR